MTTNQQHNPQDQQRRQPGEQALHVGEMVSIPASRHGEYAGTIGTVASKVFPNPFDSTPICLVDVLEGHGPALVFAVSECQALTKDAAIAELTGQWGYRDITALIRRVNDQLDAVDGDMQRFDYLCVLQQPDGSPLYCHRERKLFKELNDARVAGHRYEQCPAPDPAKNLWMVIGNFDLEDDEDQREAAQS